MNSVDKNCYTGFKRQLLRGIIKSLSFGLILCFSYAGALAQSSDTLLPVADAYVRNGSYASTNYGSDTILTVKSSTQSGFTRSAYLKFSLASVSSLSSAKLRIYGRNTDNTTSVSVYAYGVDNDTWTESGITWNNAPGASTASLSTVSVNDQGQYYELDVTDYVRSQAGGDKVLTLLIKDPNTQNKNLAFNSKENLQNAPKLIITNTPVAKDSIPPVVSIRFNDTTSSPNTYNNQVKIAINSSDSGGSGLASTTYSLNGGAYKPYTAPFTIDSTGNYTIKAKAADGDGNVSETSEIAFSIVSPQPTPSVYTLPPVADAFVRNGSYASINYGADTTLTVKSSTSGGFTRSAYLKFSLGNISSLSSAKLRIYGRNTDNTSSISIYAYGVDNDAWTENGITWNNAPAASTASLSSVGVNDQGQYYELDVTNFVRTQVSGDKVVTLLIKDPNTLNKNLVFNSKENVQNQPALIITSYENDVTPPVVSVKFNDTTSASNTYTNQVKIAISSSDDGGSGLVSTTYSLNGAAYKNYTTPFIIDSAGNYTIKAKAADGNGNVSETSEIAFSVVVKQIPSSYTLAPAADAFVRDGSYAANNYGRDTALWVKGSTSTGFNRGSYLKFTLDSVQKVGSAKLRIYGRNTDNTASVDISSFGVDNDAWSDSVITFNNAPPASTALTSVGVNDQAKYYELDVSDYVKAQFAGDKVVSFLLKDIANQNKNVVFNSKDSKQNQPQLVIGTADSVAPAKSNALLFVENPDKFPSNDYFVFSKLQIPWSRDTVNYNTNHDSVAVRIHNKGIGSLTIKSLNLSNASAWKIEKLKGVAYVPGSGLPLTISSGSYADVVIRFIAVDQATRVKVLHDTLTIVSNDDKLPIKNVYLNGIWQKEGEDDNEPWAREIINAFGFKTTTGFGHSDPDLGDTLKLKGDEIRPSYFVRADTSLPVSIRQMSAYHGCCTQSESLMWYVKGSSTATTVFTHIAKDAQSVLPRRNTANAPAAGDINPSTVFGFKIGYHDWTDARKNPGGKIGIRVWKVYDAKGNIVPNCYIISNDYLGSQYTNYDYNDNMYFIRNIKPAEGRAYYSTLKPTPSALDFGEKVLQTTNSLTVNLASTGKIYADSTKDPSITISSIAIVGENKSEFSAAMPVKTVVNAKDSTKITVNFNPTSQGLKIADLLVYYNNSQSPLRVPLYGIAKSAGTTVTANYRINSGSATPLTINGKTWSADNQYAFDNLEPYSNSKLKEIAGTDEDSLYLREQSSNADKKPFRYELPVINGDYVVRLHFAELYWGAPGGGLTGGAGSRVMSVALENQLRLVNFDPTQEVGGATAIVKNIPVTVTDGKLNIDFSATVNRPMVCAVEVYSFSAAAARPAITNNSRVLENSLEKSRVYPNPLQKILNIQFPPKYAGNCNLQIVDAMGRVYEAGKIKLQRGGSNTQINISKLSLKPGFYYLRILSESHAAEMIKLVIE
jgi:hypothetical protein